MEPLILFLLTCYIFAGAIIASDAQCGLIGKTAWMFAWPALIPFAILACFLRRDEW